LLQPLTEMTKIKAKYEEIAGLQVEIRVKTIERYLEIKGLLTPEQQEKLPLGIPSQIFALEKFGTGRMMNSYLLVNLINVRVDLKKERKINFPLYNLFL